MKALVVLLVGLVLGYVIATKVSDSQQETFIKSHEIFCKECCWKWSPTMKDGDEIDIIYTCSKDKDRLWRKVK